MKSEFRVQVLSVLAIVISITALTIGFAAFSSTLTIEGTATVENTSWDVHFETLSGSTLVGSAVVNTPPTINTNNAVLSTYDVSLSVPGDSVSYTVNVKNSGSYDAILSSIIVPTPTCTGTGTYATTDETNVCNNLTYTLTYSDGTVIQTGDIISAGDSETLKLTLEYVAFDDSSLLPTDDVAISNLGISLVYAQN